MKKVILLIRVSTVYQDYEAQKDELIRYAKSHGYTDDDIIVLADKESAT
jgi:DNA invertase Pin-like site-specific DNA recombinase